MLHRLSGYHKKKLLLHQARRIYGKPGSDVNTLLRWRDNATQLAVPGMEQVPRRSSNDSRAPSSDSKQTQTMVWGCRLRRCSGDSLQITTGRLASRSPPEKLRQNVRGELARRFVWLQHGSAFEGAELDQDRNRGLSCQCTEESFG